MRRAAFLALFVLLAAPWAGVRAGEPPGDLAARVEAYLAEPDDAVAAGLLDAIVADAPDAGTALGILRAAPAEWPAQDRFFVPHAGQRLACDVRLPKGLSRDGPRPPVVLDVSGGSMLDWLKLEGTIQVAVPGYTPPQFGDEGRDGFLAVLRATAWRYHGDPDRLWMTGFSWAAHAAWDTALHRPGALAGIASFGGGPRRKHFRLAGNLAGTAVLAFCGRRDDPELVWNLEEMERVSERAGFSYAFEADPDRGHTMPLSGYEGTAAAIAKAAPPAEPPTSAEGTILADGPLVESPLIRIDEVDGKRVAVPARIPVPANLDRDGMRRATVKAMEKAVATIRWKWSREEGRATVELRPRSVEALTVLARAPFVLPGDTLTVRVGRKTVFDGRVAPDVRTILEDARRTENRLRPALCAISARP